jgi:hypothetical protein
MTRLWREPERDPELGEALRRLELGRSAADEAALRRRIMLAAQPALARLQNPPRPWWEWMAGWSHLVIPAGVAVSLAAGAVLLTEPGSISPAWSEGDSVTISETMLSAATLPAGEVVADQLLAPATDDWLLRGAYER